jgi:hypothetical protein
LYKLNTATTYTTGVNNSSAWTLVGSQSIATSPSVSFNQFIPSSSITLAAGEIRGFYLLANTGFGGGPNAYLSTDFYSGNNYFNDAVLKLSGGVGSNTAFGVQFGTVGSNTNFRLFYGKVNYCC